jgi:hypothetical protein
MANGTSIWGSFIAFVFACIFALVGTGCGGGSELASAKSAAGQPGMHMVSAQEAAPEAAAHEDADEAPAAPPAPPSPMEGAIAQGPAGPTKPQAADVPTPTPGIPVAPEAATSPVRSPLLIYTATVTLAVFGTKDAIGAVEELARGLGGYLVARSDETVTVRVPAKAFQGALSGVSKLGDELHRDVNVRDVTEQFADLEVRLKNAEAVRLRLESLLQKAAKVEDALAVERELERVTQTIEQIKGRMRLLGELIAFSTITVNFRARPQDQVGPHVRLPFDWLGELGLPPLMNLEAP